MGRNLWSVRKPQHPSSGPVFLSSLLVNRYRWERVESDCFDRRKTVRVKKCVFGGLGPDRCDIHVGNSLTGKFFFVCAKVYSLFVWRHTLQRLKERDTWPSSYAPPVPGKLAGLSVFEAVPEERLSSMKNLAGQNVLQAEAFYTL